jgi:predicted dehydrogenase
VGEAVSNSVADRFTRSDTVKLTVSEHVKAPRLGFLGVGWIGRHRLEAIERSGLAEVAGISDPALDDSVPFEELLERGLDGIVVATPSALHAEQAVAALEAGLAVFCQKPLARTAAEARRVVDAARAADRLLAVDLSYRHAEAFRRAVELVRGGELGEIVAVDLVFHNAYGPDKPWFRDPELAGGGCLIDLGVHLVDLAQWALGRARFERVEARLLGEPVEHHAVAQLDEVRLACSWNLHAGHDAVICAAFYGSEGGVEVTNVGGSFTDFRCERFRGTSRETIVEPPDDWGGRAAVAWVERLARGESGFSAQAEELVALHETIDRIYGRAA